MEGLIFNIKKYAVHDGPGIRVTFFLKGCPLKCLWCHNPEGISPEKEAVMQKRKIGGKEFSEEEVAGKSISTDEIIEILEGEKIFLASSGGGVTFSGGEPLLQFEFLMEALKACRENGFHTAVDTSGFTTTERLKAIIPLTDLFLFDLKHLDEEKHLEYTGALNRDILASYLYLARHAKEIFVRIPVIPGYNDDEAHLLQLQKFLTETRSDAVKKICLLPYHKTGMSKYRKLNLDYRMADIVAPSASRMSELKNFFSSTGIAIKTGG